jgi:hypothetical protein
MANNNNIPEEFNQEYYPVMLNEKIYKLPLWQDVAYFFIHAPCIFQGCEFRVIITSKKTRYYKQSPITSELYIAESICYSARVEFDLIIFNEPYLIPIVGWGDSIDEALEKLLINCSKYSKKFEGKLQPEDVVFDIYDPDKDHHFIPNSNELEND